jgi:hypothetical protein
MEKNAIVELWARLPYIRSLTFIATQGPESISGWAGNGQATVSVSRQADNIVWQESGIFTRTGSRPLSFRNVYRWRHMPNQLTLAHERFGASKPVHLLTFIDDGNGTLVTIEAHRCGADHYMATLRAVAGGLDLFWRVVGPRKQDCIDYHYYM